MHKKINTLDGVTVSDATPIRINGDTISFKANAFNSRPDATVEDILKKLPGFLVQKDGTINAMGENVQKVYVNGKEFFLVTILNWPLKISLLIWWTRYRYMMI